MLGLHDAANELRKDILRTTSETRRYTTLLVMSVSDVAVALYGSNARAVEIMQLNALADPVAIRAGTQIRY